MNGLYAATFYAACVVWIIAAAVLLLAPWIEDRAEAAEAEALTRNHRSKK